MGRPRKLDNIGLDNKAFESMREKNSRKQHVNLNDAAMNVLLNDLITFEDFYDENEPNVNSVMGRFINRVLKNLDIDLDEYKGSIKGNKRPDKGNGRAISLWISDDIKEEYDLKSVFDDNSSLRGAVIQKCFEEEYAAKPSLRRQEIYYADCIRVIDLGIKKKIWLDVKFGNKQCSILPYVRKAYLQYYYIAALEIDHAHPTKVNIAAYRIERFKQTPIISDDQNEDMIREVKVKKKELERKLEENDIAFLTGQVELFKVSLNKEGEKQFARSSYLRPSLCAEREEDPTNADRRIYSFQCTERQLFQYFLRFGPRAEILGPDKLRNEIAKWYFRAAERHVLKNDRDEMVFKIALSPRGVELYESGHEYRLFRPFKKEQKPAQGDDGWSIYEFKCTAEQIERYFFKFGPDVKILEPHEMADRFAELYRKAAALYA